jgi:hypothetical protein
VKEEVQAMKKIANLLVVVILLFVSSCSLSTTPVVIVVTATVPLETMVAQSLAGTMTALSPGNGDPSNPPANGSAPTSTPKFTPTLEFTDTPQGVTVSVSVQTNCRSGPGTPYDGLGILNVGQTAQVVGRNAASDFWIIQNPANPAQTCWLWGQYATLSGDTSGLTVYTPPPTPTPRYTATPEASFQVSFVESSPCPIAHWFDFLLTNDGGITWESVHVSLTNQTHPQMLESSFNEFDQCYSCDIVSAAENLEPGESVHTGYGLSLYTIGDTITATIKVCSQDNELGTCMTKSITFTP